MVKPTAIDLFSGCGGLTLGLKRAGFQVIGAVEKDAVAVETYRANHSEVTVWRTDISKVQVTRVMRKLKLRRGDVGLLAGCPPCQGFSILRTRNGAKRNRDPRNDLVKELLRFARALRPRAVMMENVPGLHNRKPFRDLCDGLSELGYELSWAIKDAADFGVPQRRRRLVLLAGLGFKIPFAAKSERMRTVRDAIGKLPRAGQSGDWLHDMPEKRTERVLQLIRDIPKNGGSRSDLSKRRQLKCHRQCNGFNDIYGRLAWDNVSTTITSGCFNPSKGRFLHPSENRAITMREAALLQTFPRRYRFARTAGKEAIALLVGNALPPEFVRRHAIEVIKVLKQHREPRANQRGAARRRIAG